MKRVRLYALIAATLGSALATDAQVTLTPVNCRQEANLRSGQSTAATSIEFVNRTTAKINVYWLNGTGRRVFYNSLAPSQSYVQSTYVSHPWLIADAQERCLAIFLPARGPGRAMVAQPPQSAPGRKTNVGTPASYPASPSFTQIPAAQPTKLGTVQDRDFLFAIRSCQKSGQGIGCSGSVVNQAPQRRKLWLDLSNSYVLDSLGNQYRMGELVLGAQGNVQTLEPNLEMNFSLAATNVYSSPASVNIVLHYGYEQQAPYRYEASIVTFRQIPLQTAGGISPDGQLPSKSPSGPATPTIACAGATDRGYSLQVDGRLYRVKSIAPQNAGQVFAFFDQNGLPVGEPTLLQELAWGAWVREKIVASRDTRTRSDAISAILGASQKIQRSEMALDALARAMAVALEGAATGWASLGETVPSLAWSFVRSQLASPRTARALLMLSAQNGLRLSLGKYQQLEAILRPLDSTALDVTTLRRQGVQNLYFQAYLLELPNEALATALMPTTIKDNVDQALQSILSQLIAGLPGANEAVTLQGLFELQESIAEAGKGFPALQAYYESFNRALSLRQTTDLLIAAWAQQAATACGQAASGVGSAGPQEVVLMPQLAGKP